VHLIVVFVGPVHTEKGEEEEAKPESTIAHELHVVVVVHGIVWTRSLEVNNIRAHPMLELDSILLVKKGCILMMIVQVVMNLGRVELARVSKCFASEGTSVFAWNTTVIVAKMVDGVLLSVLLELVKTILSISAASRSILGDNTSLISLIPAEGHIKLGSRHGLIEIRVLLAREIVVCTGV
jgi:hypothetical protein